MQLLFLFLFISVLFTKVASTLRFNKQSMQASKGQPVIPLIPYWIPGLYHLFPFLRNTAEFPLAVV